MAKYSPFRIPKDIPPEIRRALRLGKPGRFLSTVKALQLQDLLEVADREAEARHAKAAAKLETVRRRETKEKYYGQLRAAQRDGGAIRRALDQLSESAGREPLPPLSEPEVKPVIDTPEVGPDHVIPGERAREWEVGVDYTEEVSGYRHQNGRASDVTFNARLFRPDRQTMTEYQVREAMERFTAGEALGFMHKNRFQRVEVRTVTWTNWKGRETISTHEDDLDSFRNILHRVGDAGLRVGAVKPDRL